MKPKTTSSAPKVLPPIGAHPARLCQIIMLGSQVNQAYPNSLPAEKIKLVFELCNTRHVFNPEKGEQPFVVSIKETFSFGEKANFRKHIESWIGKPLDKDIINNFDMQKFLRKVPCQVIVTHVPKKSDPTVKYEKVTSIIPAAGVKPNPLMNPTFVFSMDPNTPCIYNDQEISVTEAFKHLTSWDQKDVEASPEWKELIAGGGATTSSPANGSSDDEDDVPY